MAARVLKGMVTQERVEKAFSKIKSDPKLQVAGARYELLREDRYQEILKFLTDYFVPDEPIARSVGISTIEEVTNLWWTTIEQNMSIILVSTTTGEIIATRLMGIMNKGDKPDLSGATDGIKIAFDVLGEAYKINNIFDHYDVKDVLHFFGLCTKRDLREAGMAKTIFEAALCFVKELGIKNIVVLGDGASNYSKLIYERFGFTTLSEIMYADYKKDGEVVLKDTEPHKSLRIYAKVV